MYTLQDRGWQAPRTALDPSQVSEMVLGLQAPQS